MNPNKDRTFLSQGPMDEETAKTQCYSYNEDGSVRRMSAMNGKIHFPSDRYVGAYGRRRPDYKKLVAKLNLEAAGRLPEFKPDPVEGEDED